MARTIAPQSLPGDDRAVGRASMTCLSHLEDIEGRIQWQEDPVGEPYQSHSDNKCDESKYRVSFPAHSHRDNAIQRQSFSDLLIGELKFIGMDDRQKQILDASESTFDWAYDNHQQTGNLRSGFRNWLESDLPQFWISGVAGSGKSTMMKSLGQHAGTRESLQTWASPKRLLTASFYFWDSGTVLQNSKLGLFQSVLHNVLSQCPELAASVFPAQWEAYDMFSIDVCDTWSCAELEQAFKRLIDEGASHRRLCLFIDGIDAMHGDIKDTVDFLKILCSSSSDLKICFSSRPRGIFEEYFGGGPKLILQELASVGISRWIDSELGRNTSFSALEVRKPGPAIRLKDNIVTKASGVFLLAELMMRSLLAGLMYGDRISDLQRRLDTLPGSLEGLLEQILNSLDALYMEHACRLFQLVHAAMSTPTLLCLYFADEENPTFYAECDITHLTPEEIASRADTMRRRIKSRCKGLLQFNMNYQTPGNPPDSPLNCRVNYLHSAVKDFLLRRDIWERISTTAGPSFNPDEALCKSYIIQLKVLPPQYLLPDSFWDLIGLALEYYARAQRHIMAPLTKLLDELDHAATMWFLQSTSPAGTLMQAHYHTSSYHWTSTLTTDWKRGVRGPATSSFLTFAVRCQLCSYVEAQLSGEPGVEISVLLYTAVDDYLINISNAPSCTWNRPSYNMIELLLARGADPNKPHGWTTSWDRVIEQYLPDLAKDRDLWEDIIRLFLRHGAELGKAPHLRHLISKRPRPLSQTSPAPQINPIERLISQQIDASKYVSPYKSVGTSPSVAYTSNSRMSEAAHTTPNPISQLPTYVSPYPSLAHIQVDTSISNSKDEILIADLSASRPRIVQITTSLNDLSDGTKTKSTATVEFVGAAASYPSSSICTGDSDTTNAFPKVKKAIRLRKRPGERDSERGKKGKGKEKRTGEERQGCRDGKRREN